EQDLPVTDRFTPVAANQSQGQRVSLPPPLQSGRRYQCGRVKGLVVDAMNYRQFIGSDETAVKAGKDVGVGLLSSRLAGRLCLMFVRIRRVGPCMLDEPLEELCGGARRIFGPLPAGCEVGAGLRLPGGTFAGEGGGNIGDAADDHEPGDAATFSQV